MRFLQLLRPREEVLLLTLWAVAWQLAGLVAKHQDKALARPLDVLCWGVTPLLQTPFVNLQVATWRSRHSYNWICK